MRLIFFDTEFTGLVVDPALISIGFVDEGGEQTFYAELSDTWRLEDAGDFVRLAVLPLLKGGEALMTFADLRTRLSAWPEASGEPVKLVTDSLAWDWPWIQEIFLDAWPANVDGKPALMHELVEYPAFDREVERAFATGLRRHHALDDAKANRLGWLAAQREKGPQA